VAAVLPPGWTRSELPAFRKSAVAPLLPQWAYTAAAWDSQERRHVAWALHTDTRGYWDPATHSTPELARLVEARLARDDNPLLRQVAKCALEYRCFTAQNTFYPRDEGAIPASSYTPMGSWLVTADQVGDPQKLKIECRVNGEVRQSSNTDDVIFSFAYTPMDGELTGLPGRRALNEQLLKLGSRYAIAMVDIDHFKLFNDDHGHDVGDQLLRMVGARLLSLEGGGQAFRFGGEEFSVLFDGKTREEAAPVLEKFRADLASAPFIVRGKSRPRKKPTNTPLPAGSQKKVSVTVSIGVAAPEGSGGTPEQVIKAADATLYRAKRSGRNKLST
jgi:diguanylate cyclase (GGDEF)-like protein